ncbi:hypothetical protein [Kaistella palustris]|uniref:hypothetical protein n=1 Tax=Kaistella palustris TaxID=493376 RepID=UPI00041D4F7D|nr:hypothetical protein [Kaistella palustris]
MNTPEYNFEQEIKKQIDAREITPARDLWAEIESQIKDDKPAKPKINGFLVAAGIALLFSLGFIFINNNNETPEPQIVELKNLSEDVPAEKAAIPKISVLKPAEMQALPSKKSVEVYSPELRFQKNKNIAVKNAFPLENEKQNTDLPAIKDDVSPQVIAFADSAKTAPKRKRFVDPATLLFSVEHKDVIEKTKDGSNVATIDLNSK